jgi:acetyl esterase/lipase/ubiquinone/menaquinone biosynthesis C-methylase UbiE
VTRSTSIILWRGILASAILVLASGHLSAADDRDQWQQPDRVVRELGLKPGAKMADIGCGSGYFTFRLAETVGPEGKVYAVDVSDSALKTLRQRVEREKRTNIEVVQSQARDTKLQPGSVDAAMFCIVLHDVPASDRLPLLQNTARALKPQGVLFIVDFKKGMSLKMHTDEQLISRDDFLKLAADAGLAFDAEFHYLKQQVFLRFVKPAAPAPAAENPLVLDLWPGLAPGEKGDIGEEKLLPPQKEAKPVARLSNVSKPTIAVYRPPKEKDTGAAVVICPGGGYHILAMDLEGTEVAEWLNSFGVTGIVLKYRVPARKDRPRHEAPLQDAQRALGIVRARSKEWGIDPKRIGVLGFSAGGHLAAATSTNYDKRIYDAVDDADKLPSRPDFAVLVYPAYLMAGTGLAPEIRVNEQSPPVFFVHASNDGINAENSIGMYQALKRAKVPAEMHVYATGGHGFGLRPSENPCCTWPQRCAEWMKGQGLLKKSP